MFKENAHDSRHLILRSRERERWIHAFFDKFEKSSAPLMKIAPDINRRNRRLNSFQLEYDFLLADWRDAACISVIDYLIRCVRITRSLLEMILIDHEFKILFFTIYLYGNRVSSMNPRRNIQFLILRRVIVYT